MSARLSSLFSRTTACANGADTTFCCLHVPARAALLTALGLVDAMAGRMIFVPCLYAPVRVGTFMCSAVCVVMRCEKRVRTKKRVAFVCFSARDAARAIEGGFWTLAHTVQKGWAGRPAVPKVSGDGVHLHGA